MRATGAVHVVDRHVVGEWVCVARVAVLYTGYTIAMQWRNYSVVFFPAVKTGFFISL